MIWTNEQSNLVGEALGKWEKQYGRFANLHFHKGCKILSGLLFYDDTTIAHFYLLSVIQELDKIENLLNNKKSPITDSLLANIYCAFL